MWRKIAPLKKQEYYEIKKGKNMIIIEDKRSWPSTPIL